MNFLNIVFQHKIYKILVFCFEKSIIFQVRSSSGANLSIWIKNISIDNVNWYTWTLVVINAHSVHLNTFFAFYWTYCLWIDSLVAIKVTIRWQSLWTVCPNFYEQKQPLEVLWKKGILKNCANFTGKHLYWSPFLIKLQAWTPILKNICERLHMYEFKEQSKIWVNQKIKRTIISVVTKNADCPKF